MDRIMGIFGKGKSPRVKLLEDKLHAGELSFEELWKELESSFMRLMERARQGKPPGNGLDEFRAIAELLSEFFVIWHEKSDAKTVQCLEELQAAFALLKEESQPA